MLAFYKSLPLLAIAVISLAIPDAMLVNTIPKLYAAAFAWTLYATYSKREGMLSFYRPSTLMVCYVCFFFAMGSYAFANNWVLDVVGQLDYSRLTHLRTATFYFLFAAWGTLLSQWISKQLRAPVNYSRGLRKSAPLNASAAQIGLSLFIGVLSVCIEIPLPGGDGSFSSCFFMFSAFHLSYSIFMKNSRLRFLLYAGVCAVIAIRFYEDRRLVAFYVFTIVFLELHGGLQLRIRTIIASTAVSASVVVLVIAMSIQRGVGEFDAETMLESITYVDDYLTSDWAKTMLFHNFEGPATTFHSYNAADYILETKDISFGSTFAKTLFLPVPRSICEWKPRSMVDAYMTHFYPVMRANGVSFVPNFYAEALWNFGFAGGFLFVIVAFFIGDAVFDSALSRFGEDSARDTLFLASQAFLIFFFRGCGLELYILSILIFLMLAVLYRLFPQTRQVVLPSTGKRLPQNKRLQTCTALNN